MGKKSVGKDLYLGIDQGSTATKALLVTTNGEVIYKSRRRVKTSVTGSNVFQDPRSVLRSVKSSLSEALSFALERQMKVCAAGLATQRSSFLFFDSKGMALTPIVSWRDTSGAELIASLSPEKGRIKKITGLPLTPYYSASKMKKCLPSRKADVLFGTVNTYLIYNLTGGKVFATDPANAQRTLLLDIRKLDYSEELLNYFSIPEYIRFPEVRDTVDDFGNISLKGATVPITASTGDQQAAFIASSGWETGRGLINLGTGGFLLVPVEKIPENAGDLIVTLSNSVKGKASFLLEGTVNAISDALHYFENFLGREYKEGELLERTYPIVVFGARGTGAPLWDSPFPAAMSGISAGSDWKSVIASSLLGSLCYFRLIDEEMERAGWDAEEYVVSGGISAIDGVSRFLRDLLNKRVYRSKVVEMTGVGAALAGRFLGAGLRFPAKRKNFRLVGGKGPVDADAYFSEWVKLYHFARQRAGR